MCRTLPTLPRAAASIPAASWRSRCAQSRNHCCGKSRQATSLRAILRKKSGARKEHIEGVRIRAHFRRSSMISRRAFFGLAAGVPAVARTVEGAETTSCNPPNTSNVPVRKTGMVEIAFKSPGPEPNGLQATKDGLWIIDQSEGSKAYLVDYADGAVRRSFETDTVRPSGITFDGEALWIGSTFSYENVRCDARTGAVLERRPTPGSIMYTMVGDAPQRRSPLAGGPLAQPRPAPAESGPPLARLTQPPSNRLQGAHGQEWRAGRLWTTSTSARSIFEIEPKEWVVQKIF